MMLLSILSKPGEDFVFSEEMAILSSFSEKGASKNWLGPKPAGKLSWQTVVGHISKTSSCSLAITSLFAEQDDVAGWVNLFLKVFITLQTLEMDEVLSNDSQNF